ncbi:hypothetical protein C1645_880885 [Glomus cerebriforme]|uniref:Actin-like ATPase domain-containing protein n=1 Tax=Glomus cerebriforme TaxID=658196 RepID=A0A397S9U1_9GLOM|nr:hypothetical protein C1645_880885 [Glomus cerebriforme]
MGSEENNIRVVVGLDFGTSYSGFAYCHVNEYKNLVSSNDLWHGEVGQLKTNTVLQYDNEYNNVKSWGAPALAKKQTRRTRQQDNTKDNRPVELFKLHLGDLLEEFKPKLPDIDYKKAITDYLRKIGQVIKETIAKHWPMIDYFKNVLLIITIPAIFPEKSKAIMRICAFNAGLIEKEHSINLQFTTEPEAAAVYCIENLKGETLARPGTNFMIVDCGGGTVDLTVRKLINDNQLGEITESSGGFCGSTFIDKEFIKYLRKVIGDKPMDLLDKNYEKMQYLIQQFCKYGKIPFTGDDPDFSYELDIQDTVPILKQYISDDDVIETLEEDEWVIEIDSESMKSIFEPVVQEILFLIKSQLDSTQETCSAMFLVGGFSESKYLQKRIKEKFNRRVENISVPIQPIAAIARGASIYGLSIKSNDLNNVGNDDNKCVISTRVLKYTYGIEVSHDWKEGDPIRKKTYGGHIDKFGCLVKRGTEMNIDQEITNYCVPLYSYQMNMTMKIYYTQEYDGEYCDDPGMKLLGTLTVGFPGSGFDRCVLFGLTFGKMEIIATSKDKQTGQIYKTTFKYSLDD